MVKRYNGRVPVQEGMMDSRKIERVLGLYTKLMNGSVIYKSEEALHYNVNERTIQRDLDDIRSYMENAVEHSGIINDVIYDRRKRGYRLEQSERKQLSNGEILAVCKILLDSRAFPKDEMISILQKLIESCVPEKNKRQVNDLIQNEEFHYVELRHHSHFVEQLWEIGQAIRHHNYIEIEYERLKDHAVVSRRLEPVAILFSEYYFYLTAFIDCPELRKEFEVPDDIFPTIYRIDRIRSITVSEEKFYIPYASRFEEGEFRKRVQFMYGGKLQKVLFRYSGADIDAVLDRLPTAQIVKEEDGIYTVSAEVFGKGIDMWFRSQGDAVEVIEERGMGKGGE